jgi:tRNA isopentenyl-2-thiomethyl-A-37 hydroxylase MiaE
MIGLRMIHLNQNEDKDHHLKRVAKPLAKRGILLVLVNASRHKSVLTG